MIRITAALAIALTLGASVRPTTLAAPEPQPAARPTSRPNIVWISNEDMSPRLGAYGDRLARTPGKP